MNPISLIRDNIRALEPYSTARDEFKGGDISVWLDANESPYPTGVNRYPDPHQKSLKTRISSLFNVPAESIFLGGAGSDEAIDVAIRIFCRPGIDNMVAISPSYGVYKVAADINDIKIREVCLNPDFSLPVERILEAADADTKIIWICSPNNPTGNAFPREEILRVVENFNGMVAVDEAYVDFSDKGSMADFIATHSNLIVLRTFSKAWGMAGMRCGMAFAAPEVIRYFDRVKHPYNMSSIIQKELLKRIEIGTADHIPELRNQREILADGIKNASCVEKVFPSDANFILIRVADAGKIYDYLTKHGVIVRNRSRLPLCENTLRITVGTPLENQRVINLLNAYGTDLHLDRTSAVSRDTTETRISVEVNLEGKGESKIDTGLKFFDHMLQQIPHHSGISLRVVCKGDLEVDEHHTMEDVGIALGEALLKALGDKRGIERYGFVLPMDESRAMVLIDLGGRIEFQWDVEFTREYVGDTPTEMFAHFFQSVCHAMKCNLHISAKGENNHHIIEGVFKAFARALRMAIRRDPFSYAPPSSKGIL